MPKEKSMQMVANKQFYQCLQSDIKFNEVNQKIAKASEDERNDIETNRFWIYAGGSRSGKTYAIIQFLIYKALVTPSDRALSFTIVRKWLPSLKESVYIDFQEILTHYGHYQEEHHNKSDLKYNLNGHTFKFLATADQPDRLRSMKRDILYINEVNELSKEEFRQLNLRTTMYVLMDYNPSMSEHWVYDLEDNRPTEVNFYHSIWKDNHFLSTEQKREILALQQTDPEAWKVYGQGERATLRKGRVFKGWEQVYDLPEGDVVWGIDFGWHPDPTAIVKIVKTNDAFYIKEIMYSTKATEEDIMLAIRNNDYRNEPLWCDHNQKQIIEALKRSGYNAMEARKGTGSIIDGINFIKRSKVFYTKTSKNLEKEYNSYSWKMKKGFDPDDPNAYEQFPEDKNNHIIDATRYALFSSYFVSNRFFVV